MVNTVLIVVTTVLLDVLKELGKWDYGTVSTISHYFHLELFEYFVNLADCIRCLSEFSCLNSAFWVFPPKYFLVDVSIERNNVE
jgi:hypothetical protein